MEDERVLDLLRANGFSFKRRYGQNFITDRAFLGSVADMCGLDADTAVVEIGCGAGTLTRELAERAKYVYAYEIDESLRPVLAVTLGGVENCEVIFRDFMRTRMDVFEETMEEYVVAANLPYYITTPLIMLFIEHSRKCRSLTVMVQEDVAKRICASPGTAEYGAITAQIALRGDARMLRRVGREMFRPRPNVDSALVRIDIRDGRIPARDPDMYKRCVRAAFANRRKTLENNLVSAFSLTRDEAKGAISACGLPADIRGERLSPEEFCALADAVAETAGDRVQGREPPRA